MRSLAGALVLALLATPCGMAQSRTSNAQTDAAKFHISGVIVNATSGEAVQGAEVVIRPTNVRAPMQTTRCGDDGRFDFAELAAGKYSLGAQAHGFNLQALDEHENYSTGVAVGPGLDSRHIVFRLQPEGGIRGTVLDEFGEPVADARALLFYDGVVNGRGGTHSAGQSTTDDLGEFRFSHLSAGNYKLAVIAQPWYAGVISGGVRDSPDAPLNVAYPVTFFPATTEARQASPIMVRPGERAEVQITLHAVPALHLSLKGQDTSVQLQQKIFDDLEFVSSASGDAKLDVAPGHYLADLNGSNSSYHQAAVDVEESTELDPQTAPSFPRITANMHFDDPGLKAEGLAIELHNFQNGEIRQGQANKKGDVQFDSPFVRPGRYYVMLRSRGFHIATVRANGASVNGRSVEIPASGAVQLDLTLAHGMGRVDGVALRDGKPFAGALVLLVPENPSGNYTLFRRDQSDSDGTFTLPQVVPGKYTAVAIADGWELEWSNPEVMKRYMAAGTKAEVANGPLKIQVKVQPK